MTLNHYLQFEGNQSHEQINNFFYKYLRYFLRYTSSIMYYSENSCEIFKNVEYIDKEFFSKVLKFPFIRVFLTEL